MLCCVTRMTHSECSLKVQRLRCNYVEQDISGFCTMIEKSFDDSAVELRLSHTASKPGAADTTELSGDPCRTNVCASQIAHVNARCVTRRRTETPIISYKHRARARAGVALSCILSPPPSDLGGVVGAVGSDRARCGCSGCLWAVVPTTCTGPKSRGTSKHQLYFADKRWYVAVRIGPTA